MSLVVRVVAVPAVAAVVIAGVWVIWYRAFSAPFGSAPLQAA